MFRVKNVDGFKDLKYYGGNVLPNTVIYVLTGKVLSSPTRTSIQISNSKHIEDKLGKYINHSCDPSVRVEDNKLISVKEINDSDSITFNYNDTEDLMSNPFKCHCCDKIIGGKLMK